MPKSHAGHTSRDSRWYTMRTPECFVPHSLGILETALIIWLRVSSSAPTVEAWPHPGMNSTTACGTICCKNSDVWGAEEPMSALRSGAGPGV